jgi:cobaltochelatase CobS
MIDQSLVRIDEKGNEKVECMECHQAGTPRYFHTLVVHLKNVHGMNEPAYRTKWKQPTVSTWMTSKMRAAIAKDEPPPPPKKTTVADVERVSVAEPSLTVEVPAAVAAPLVERMAEVERELSLATATKLGTFDSSIKVMVNGAEVARVAEVRVDEKGEAEFIEEPKPAPEPKLAVAKKAEQPKRVVVQQVKFGRSTLPVYDLTSHNEQRLVPKMDEQYEINMEFFEDMSLAVEDHENLLIVGPTGCGKTTGVEMLAAICNHPLMAMNMRSDFKSSAFLGQPRVIVDPIAGKQEMRFVDGMLPRAMANGFWLLVDEFDYCPSGILYTLQRVLSHKQLVLDEDSGRIIDAHPDFRLIATANTIGRGDDTGLYAGAQVLSEATLDRFATTIEARYIGTGKYGNELPNDDQEVTVVRSKTNVALDLAKNMVTTARLVRNGVEREECYCSFSTRRLIDWGRKTMRLGGDYQRAAATTFLNKMTGDDRKYVAAIVDRTLGRRP